MNLVHWLAFIAIAIVSFSGCQKTTTQGSATASPDASSQLVALGKAYHSYHLKHKKGPSNWEEAMAAGDSAAISALRDQGCQVAWGIRFRDATIGAAYFVLAYPPSTLENGGPVLLLDGSVRQAKPEPLQAMLESQAEIGVPQ